MRRLTVLPLRTWLVLSHLVVLLLPVIAVLATRALAYDLRDQTRRALEYQGVLIAILAADEVADARAEGEPTAGLYDVSGPLNAVLYRTKRATLAGIRLVNPTGIVVASSGDGLGQDLSNDEEVHQALTVGEVGVAVRPRPGRSSADIRSVRTPSRRASVRLFVTVPILLEGEQLGAVVLSRTPREEVQAIYQMAPRLWWGALLAILTTIALALFYGYLFSRSLRGMARAAPQIALRPDQADALLARARRSHVREVARVADALTDTAARLDERLAYIGEFAANVSHEFKTPLSTLRGTLELIQDDPAMPDEQRARFMANAEAEVHRLERLVTGLLALARAERTRERAPVDVHALVQSIADRHPGTAVSGTSTTVQADAEQLDVVIDNLVANAHKHGAAPVRVSVQRRGHTVIIAVSDNGPGISDGNIDRLFDRFFTTKRGDGGTGLGLALARTIAQGHGGDLTVHSEPGNTVFRLTLPV